MYNIFISHSWSYGSHYDALLARLDSYPNFYYKNYSVPKDDPIHNASNESQLKVAIKNQMQHASCILILAGVYANYSKWINIEMQLAKELGKKIIAVEPFGAERTSSIVKNTSDVVVKWNSQSIVDAIKSL